MIAARRQSNRLAVFRLTDRRRKVFECTPSPTNVKLRELKPTPGKTSRGISLIMFTCVAAFQSQDQI
jgi:hypothetical protein